MKIYKLVLCLPLAITFCACSKGPTDPGYIDPPSYDEDSIQIHYQREDRNFDNWAVWLWQYPSGSGEEYLFNGTDEFGAIAAYPLSYWPSIVDTHNLGFVIKSKGSWEEKDVDIDRIMKLNMLEKDNKGIYHIYLVSGDENIYINKDLQIMDEVECARFTDLNKIQIKTKTNFRKLKLYENDTLIKEITEEGKEKEVTLSSTVSFDSLYHVDIEFATGKNISQNINMNKLFKTDEFSNKYNYDGNDLGATYTQAQTTFKVWSPLSNKVVLKIYNNGTPTSISPTRGGDEIYKEAEMTKGEKGVFSVTIEGDLARKYYTYTITNATYKNREIVDPYAKSCGVNGLRGMIVDFSKTNPEGFNDIAPLNIDRKALTVYETHIADLTSSDTWTNDAEYKLKAKTYEAFMTEGTTYTDGIKTVATGFDHIKELGVNAVQILPFFDHANDEVNPTFNWGYNPLNYNCLDGIYSANPYDGYVRIKEFKSLVKAYHDANINIIMDVVYNHVNSAIGSNFDVLLPGYYYRYLENGELSNGSGCGNETASDLYMMRKFMIDSACFWAKEYKLGGFRFDLMGLHDLDTMKQIVTEVKKINPNIVIYGEPWAGGASTLPDDESAKQMNINKYEGYGAFNDQMRDALIKGGLNPDSAQGWITNNTSASSADDLKKIKKGILGHTYVNNELDCIDPNKTVNYVTCHDNYTLYDRIKKSGIEDEEITKKMAMLSNSVIFTSNGTTFMLAGEEFLRTKGGDGNSYNSGYEVNELDYSLKIKNFDMFENYQKLIELKQKKDFLHLDSTGTLNLEVSANKIRYTATSNANQYIVIHTNGYDDGTTIQEDLDGYTIYLDTIDSNKKLSATTTLQPYETLIAYKSQQ